MSLADLQALVDNAVRDKDGVISADARDLAITHAVARYSLDCPRRVVADAVSAGGSSLAAPAGWLEQASEVLAVEFPIGMHPASTLDPDAFGIYRSPVGDEIRLGIELAAGDSVRLEYTAAHAVDDTTDTVPVAHHYAVSALAASMLCGQLASYYATEGAPTISADVTDHRGKTERYASRAKVLLADYERIIGVPDRSATPRAASATVTIDSRDAFGERRLFHPPREWAP